MDIKKQELLQKREKLEELKGALKERFQIQTIEKEIIEIDYQLDEFEDEDDVLPPKTKKRDIAPFYRYLKEAHASYLRLKRMKFFVPIFQRHPTVVMAEKIYLAASIAKKIKPDFPEFAPFFDELILETEKKWNKELYDHKIADLFHRFETLLHSSQT